MNVAVKLKAISLVAVCTLFYVNSLSAQEGANRRNAAAALLKRFPDADTDGNGELSMQEALAYAEAHPEVRQLLSQRPEKATGPRVTQAGSRSTRDVNWKELGPRVCVCAHSFMIFTGQQLPRSLNQPVSLIAMRVLK